MVGPKETTNFADMYMVFDAFECKWWSSYPIEGSTHFKLCNPPDIVQVTCNGSSNRPSSWVKLTSSTSCEWTTGRCAFAKKNVDIQWFVVGTKSAKGWSGSILRGSCTVISNQPIFWYVYVCMRAQTIIYFGTQAHMLLILAHAGHAHLCDTYLSLGTPHSAVCSCVILVFGSCS